MVRNVLALVALVIFGSLNTLTAESIDAVAPAAVEAVSADLAPAPKEEIKATNVLGDDEENYGDEEEKISSDERSFGLEEEEDDFD